MKSVTWKQARWLLAFAAGLLAMIANADAYVQHKVEAAIDERAATRADILRLENKIDHITDILIESGPLRHR